MPKPKLETLDVRFSAYWNNWYGEEIFGYRGFDSGCGPVNFWVACLTLRRFRWGLKWRLGVGLGTHGTSTSAALSTPGAPLRGAPLVHSEGNSGVDSGRVEVIFGVEGSIPGGLP